MIYGRTCFELSSILFNIIFAFIFLIFTPFHLGFISGEMGLNHHPNKISNRPILSCLGSDRDLCEFCLIIFYSFLRGLLMFPYIITFFPFLVLILLPGIISKKYYFRVMVVYWSAMLSGNKPLKNLQGL